MRPFESTASRYELYDCGDGAHQATYWGVSLAEYNSYLTDLQAGGYARTAQNTLGSNLFSTLFKGTEGISVAYFPAEEMAKVTVGLKNDYTGSPAGAAVVAPTLAQLGREGAILSGPTYTPYGAPGMSYVLQISDGRYILIDGGPANANDQTALYNYLVANNPDKTAGAKPVIAAWIFTHPHGDHMQLACDFIDAYHGKVEIQATLANFPNTEKLVTTNENPSDMQYWMDRWNTRFAQYYPTAPNHKVHTGEQLIIGDAVIDIFYTQEDFFPLVPYGSNDLSLAFRVKLGSKSILFLGDCDGRSTPYIAKHYGTAVKCDILQLTHHGFNGGDLKLYQYADPDICLWPVEEERFTTDYRCLGNSKSYDFNAWIRDDSIKVREHYHNSTDAILTLA